SRPPVPAADPSEIAAKMKIGGGLMAHGDITAGRMMVQRGAEAGEAAGGLAPAGAHDPAGLRPPRFRGGIAAHPGPARRRARPGRGSQLVRKGQGPWHERSSGTPRAINTDFPVSALAPAELEARVVTLACASTRRSSTARAPNTVDLRRLPAQGLERRFACG